MNDLHDTTQRSPEHSEVFLPWEGSRDQIEWAVPCLQVEKESASCITRE